jgi:cell wall-associated NlpC family hydrolase
VSVATVMARITAIQGQLAALGVPTASTTDTTSGTAGTGFSDTLDQTLGTTSATSSAVGGEPTPYDAMIVQAANEQGISPALLKAVVKVESGFDPNSTSSAGAKGLTQLMPETAAGFGITNPYDPMQSLRGGARELAGALKTFNGDVRLALAAYNAGVGAVKKYGGIPPYAETQAYVPKVLQYAAQYAPATAATMSLSGYGASSGVGGAVVQQGLRFLGTPYQWGGESPSTGFDCSGLAQYLYRQNGVSIPRTSQEQFRAGTPVAANALQPGDLVFFQKNGDVHHVGIYVGGGRFLQAPHTGDVVKISSLSEPYYASQYCGARRYG